MTSSELLKQKLALVGANVIDLSTFATKEELENVNIDTTNLATKEELGDLTSLTTEEKSNVVGALNEVNSKFNGNTKEDELMANINNVVGLWCSVNLVDGKIHYTHANNTNTSGLKIEGLTEKSGYLKVAIKLTDFTKGNWKLYLVGKHRFQSGNANINLKEKGNETELEMVIDLAKLNVYENLSLEEPYAISIQVDEEADFYLSEFNVYRHYENISDAYESHYNPYRISDGNNRYEIIANNGEVKLAKVIPDKVLYVGNSLLLGFDDFGMSASDVNNDYFAYTNAYLREINENLVTDKVSGVVFETASSIETSNNWITNTLTPKLSADIDLVILQIGDNVTDNVFNIFSSNFPNLVKTIRENCPNARIAVVDLWYPKRKVVEYLSNNDNNLGIAFINITSLRTKDCENVVGATVTKPDGNTITITETGVASHPNNKGHRKIADKIIDTLFK